MVFTALSWPLDRIDAALEHAAGHRHLAGAHALRQAPPGTFTLAPRLDVLDHAQHRALAEHVDYHQPLTGEETSALLAALTFGPNQQPTLPDSGRPTFIDWRTGHLDAEAELLHRH